MPTAGPNPAQRRRIVDEFGALDAKLATVRTDLRRHESLASIIRSWYAELPENQAYSAKGDKFVVIVSARENQRFISSMAKVFLLMGQKRFLAFCSLPLKVLEANAPASELCKLVASRQSGPRSLQVAAIDAAAS